MTGELWQGIGIHWVLSWSESLVDTMPAAGPEHHAQVFQRNYPTRRVYHIMASLFPTTFHHLLGV